MLFCKGDVIGPETMEYNIVETGLLLAYTLALPLLEQLLVIVLTESIVIDACEILEVNIISIRINIFFSANDFINVFFVG